jgi:hypothetical protein
MDAMSQNSTNNRVKYGDDASMCCPYCGHNYLHHKNVIVYNRDHEDSNHGLVVHSMDGSITIDDDLNGNPSGRRNGVLIYLECENCGNTYKLALYKHKGVTYLHWVY